MSLVTLECNDRGGYSRQVPLVGGPAENLEVTEPLGSFWSRMFPGKDANDYDLALNGVPKPVEGATLRHGDGLTVGVRKQDGGS